MTSPSESMRKVADTVARQSIVSRAERAANKARRLYPGPIGEALADRCYEAKALPWLAYENGLSMRLIAELLAIDETEQEAA